MVRGIISFHKCLFIYSFIDGHLGYFQFGALLNKDAINKTRERDRAKLDMANHELLN